MNDNTPQLLNQQRVRSLDFIRGIAVLGILVMNIQSFSMPLSAYMNPFSYGDFSGSNYWVWYISHLFFDQKFMTIFSILFGVGIYIFAERVDAREGHSGIRHNTRVFWLLVFGLIHAYLIWFGDILTLYAISGFFVYLLRNEKTATQLLLAFLFISLTSIFILSQSILLSTIPEEQLVRDTLALWQPSEETLKREILAYQGSWVDAFQYRAIQTVAIQNEMIFLIPKVLGLNLIGITLYKRGFFGKHWSNIRYSLIGVLFIVFGMFLTYIGVEKNLAVNFDPNYSIAFGIQYNYWGSLFSALGYCCILMLMANNIDGSVVKRAFARVGQMAFTNYILQSIICTAIFYGFGLGLFGEVERIEQLYITLGVWLVLIVFSYFWLEKFRMGPLEKLWRQLTYGKLLTTQKAQA